MDIKIEENIISNDKVREQHQLPDAFEVVKRTVAPIMIFTVIFGLIARIIATYFGLM